MRNLSKIRRDKMIEFLNRIREEHKDDDETLIAINEIEHELNSKKYGLVWEEHEEEVDVMLQDNIPVFSEVSEREINAAQEENYNFLLEGDNLHSLKLLEKTHKGKIDVIYIDPPYNTGSKDFKYNDDVIGKDDLFRHSKWLSFINERLSIAKHLLDEKGVIFISIDDNELYQIKLLCDEIFGESNFICNICRQAIKGGSRAQNIKSVNDYILIYAKNILKLKPFTGVEKEEITLESNDENGPYTKGRELNKWGAGSRREDSPSMWFPIKGPYGEEVYPIRNDGSEGRWRWGKKKMLEAVKNNNVIFEKRENGTYIVYEKLRGNKTKTIQFTSWFSDKYINAKGSESLKKVFDTMMSVFDYAKPVELVKDLIFMSNHKTGIILDFFAGSGTTAQAVLELNKEDGGNRKFILCTNNENNICEDITYQRIKTVIIGKRQDDSEYSEGIPANLKYYRTDFVSKDEEFLSDALLEHIVELIQLKYGIKIDNQQYKILISDEDADDLEKNWDKYPDIKKIFLASDILLTGRQEELFNGVDLYTVPDCFYGEELREVGELW